MWIAYGRDLSGIFVCGGYKRFGRTSLISVNQRAGVISAVASRAMAPSGRPRLAVLSLTSALHASFRCFMRASIMSLCTIGEHDRYRGQWLDVKGGGSILLRFIAPPGHASLHHEQSRHRDLLVLDEVADSGPSTCAARVVLGLRRLFSAETSGLDFVMVTDDDVWLSPPRLMHDLRELLDIPRHVLYGPLAFAAGWNAARQSHYGWAPFVDIEQRMPSRAVFRRGITLASSRGAIGPFPFLMGYCGVLSGGLAAELAHSAAAASLVKRLLATTRTRRPDPGLPRGKCYPGGDVAVGWVLAEMNRRQLLSRPLLLLDITYAQRVLPYANHYDSAVVRRPQRACACCRVALSDPCTSSAASSC